MASPSLNTTRRPVRYIAKYRCKSSRDTWKVRNSRAGTKMCLDFKKLNCSVQLRPYKTEPMDIMVIYKCPGCSQAIKRRRALSQINEHKQMPYCRICNRDMEIVPRRMFGEYKCACGNTWSSGNSWTGWGQDCKDCNEYIYPWLLRPLSSIGGLYPPKPHKEELCGMCRELGRNCRTLPSTSDDDIEDDDDLVSILTENSSIFSDEDLTPPTSGEVTPTGEAKDDADEAIVHLQNMKIEDK